MTRFKKGDFVRCVRLEDYPEDKKELVLGRVYRVTGQDNCNGVGLEGVRGGLVYWRVQKFELYNPPQLGVDWAKSNELWDVAL